MFSILNNIAKKLLPIWVYSPLVGQWNKEGIKKYAKNTTWISISRISTIITGLLTMVVVARYLGPENLGKLSYAQSFVGIFSILASLGIDQILFRDLSLYPEKRDRILGTVIVMRFILGLFTFLLVLGVSLFIDADRIFTILIATCASVFLINPFGIIAIFFEAQAKPKYNTVATIFISIFILLIKLIIIFFGKGILYFASTLVLEAVLGSIFTWYVYVHYFRLSPTSWQFDVSILKQLLSDSWPFALATLSSQIYVRVDQVMLQHYMDSTTVGLYNLAVRITQIAQLPAGLVIIALSPALLSAKRENGRLYHHRIRSLAIFAGIITCIIIVSTIIVAPFIIPIVFGTGYIDSIPIVQVHVFGVIGIVIIQLLNYYLTNENLGKIFFVSTSIAAIVNIIANYVYIPKYGGIGAAIATLISYAIVIIITSLNLMVLRRSSRVLK